MVMINSTCQHAAVCAFIPPTTPRILHEKCDQAAFGHLNFDLAVSEEDEDVEQWGRKGTLEGGGDNEVKVLYMLGRAVKREWDNRTQISNIEA
jgi:hypothetical protein